MARVRDANMDPHKSGNKMKKMKNRRRRRSLKRKLLRCRVSLKNFYLP